MKQPIKGQEGWFKDIQNGSIDCSDTSEYQKYMKAYRAQQEKEKQVETLQNDVSALKSELGDIKSLLLTLVQNQKV
jgi:hypothetical protein